MPIHLHLNMKINSNSMLKLAEKFHIKYGVGQEDIAQTLQTAISNASTLSQKTGIMPFIKMLREDGATLSLNVTRDKDEVTVSPATVNPGSVAPKYSALSMQVQNYLQNNLEVFPTYREGELAPYSNVTVTLTFNPQQIANK